MEEKKREPGLQQEFEDTLKRFFAQEKQKEIPLQELLSLAQKTIPTQPWYRRRWVQRSTLLLAPACLALLLLFGPFSWNRTALDHVEPSPTRRNTFTARGSENPHIQVALLRKDKKRWIRSGETFYLGDFFRLFYQWDRGGYVYIIHRDARGRISTFYPDKKSMPSIPLKSTRRGRYLTGSFEVIDPALGDEEIWACFSSSPIHYRHMIASLPTRSSFIHWPKKSTKYCDTLQLFLMKREPRK